MREIIPRQFWIGNATEARQILPVTSLQVEAVLDLAANELPVQFPRELVYCRFPISDGAENNQTVLLAALTVTSHFVRNLTPTFIYCSAGMSRSVAIAAGAIALAEGAVADNVLSRITSTGAHDVSPALWSEVRRLVGTLK